MRFIVLARLAVDVVELAGPQAAINNVCNASTSARLGVAPCLPLPTPIPQTLVFLLRVPIRVAVFELELEPGRLGNKDEDEARACEWCEWEDGLDRPEAASTGGAGRPHDLRVGDGDAFCMWDVCENGVTERICCIELNC
jgi:hypothetical protein